MLAEQELAAVESEEQVQPSLPPKRKFRSCARDVIPLHERITTVTFITLASAFFWFLACQGARIDSLNYSIERLQGQVQQINTVNTTLSSQLDTLARPERILGIAMGKLHMQFARPVNVPGNEK